MICRWCKGTGKECGCGLGYCAHCQKGIVTDPPFGPEPDSQDLNILKPQDFDVIIDYSIRDIPAQIDYVSIHMVGTQLLSDYELTSLKKYWDDDFRDETLGDVLNRAAWLVSQRIK